jgi:hypothetical protein
MFDGPTSTGLDPDECSRYGFGPIFPQRRQV